MAVLPRYRPGWPMVGLTQEEKMNMTQVDWLDFGERKKGCTGILIHHTGGASAESSIEWLRYINLSYHYVISRTGVVYKCVPTSKRAFHAGHGRGKYGRDVNSQTIGIALANRGDGETYPRLQTEALRSLVIRLTEVMDLEWLSTHRLVTKRKIDPYEFDLLGFVAGVNVDLPETHQLSLWMDKRLKREWNG